VAKYGLLLTGGGISRREAQGFVEKKAKDRKSAKAVGLTPNKVLHFSGPFNGTRPGFTSTELLIV